MERDCFLFAAGRPHRTTWEKKEGLPVYRHLHDKLGSIYAYRNELTEWFNGRQQSGAAGIANRTTGRPNEKIKLAVLPFGNLGGDKEDAYFSDGLTEEMSHSGHLAAGLRTGGDCTHNGRAL